MLRVSAEAYESAVEQVQPGVWAEVINKTIDDEKLLEMRIEFSKYAFEKSQSFYSPHFEMVTLSQEFSEKEANVLIQRDMIFVLLVIVACLFYMMLHQKSITLGLVSLINITMSIPSTSIFYFYVYRVSYFSSINISAVIIIIGIGCDDIFVFHEQWENSLRIKALKGDMVKRISYCFRKAVKSMFYTSFTSLAAFASTSFSKVMPIKAFGIYSMTIVFFCFFITIVVQPMVYIFYETYLMKPH
jgi:predicted RND superfamily exporter protein